MTIPFQSPALFFGGEKVFNIDYSLYLDGSFNYMTNTNNSTTTNLYKATLSFWFKRYANNTLDYIWEAIKTGDDGIWFNSSNQLRFQLYPSGSFTTTSTFTDTSAWHHIVLSVDTTQATASDRVTLWLNGEEYSGGYDLSNYPGLNDEVRSCRAEATLSIGASNSGGYPSSVYLAEFIFVNGQALAASDFGMDSGTDWIPIEYEGTYGINGFRLDFYDENDLGNDVSGNGNDFTLVSITSDNQSEDTPTN